MTFSGFDADNPLRSLGELNFWVNSHSYNSVEMVRHVWLLAAVDRLAREKGSRDWAYISESCLPETRDISARS